MTDCSSLTGIGLFCDGCLHANDFYQLQVVIMVVVYIHEIVVLIIIIIIAGMLFFISLALLGAADGLGDGACNLLFIVIIFATGDKRATPAWTGSQKFGSQSSNNGSVGEGIGSSREVGT